VGVSLIVVAGLSTWIVAGGMARPAPAGQAVATARTFALTWASDWNRWAAAHKVPQHILTVGCNYLSTEHYYLCAVRARLRAPSEPGVTCGLIVVKPGTQSDPNEQVENGMKTSCHIFSTLPQHVVT
jgi:hypothetical protein